MLTDISRPEQILCKSLAPLVRNHAVGDSIHVPPQGNFFFSALQFFMPIILREVHSEWRYEGLDDLLPSRFQKTGHREIELIGLAQCLSDMTTIPFHLCLQLSTTYDSVSWVDLKMGDCVGQSHTRWHVAKRLDSINWLYHVGYGEREL
ncbi:hypothetical protein [Stieleria sp. JC731]|uniref:hypothetical protein n=1 Tax=Stieleria sp. JC731 TaxID=2894195 RepID=UPI001E34A301|nr:hypothetical protein [Stieleria sp. JC731]